MKHLPDNMHDASNHRTGKAWLAAVQGEPPGDSEARAGGLLSGMDFLDEAERAELQRRQEANSFVRQTLEALSQILTSETFRLVGDHLRRFLAFVVAMKLLGKERGTKENTVALSAFGETDHDPKLSSKVRDAARNLRRKLADYYDCEGRRQPLQIRIPVGTYVPDIDDRRVSVAISAFENLNAKGDQAHLCAVVADELADQLVRRGLRVERRASAQAGFAGLDYGLRGFLACAEDVLTLSVWMSDLRAGRLLSNQTFEGRRDDLLRLVRQAALSVMTELRRKQRVKPRIRCRPAQASRRSLGKHRGAPSQKSAAR
jgi:TolB-like protein